MVPGLVRFTVSFQLSRGHPRGTLSLSVSSGGKEDSTCGQWGAQEGDSRHWICTRVWPLSSGFLCQSREVTRKGNGEAACFCFPLQEVGGPEGDS